MKNQAGNKKKKCIGKCSIKRTIKKNSDSAKLLQEEKKGRYMRICDSIYIPLITISIKKDKSICFITEEALLDYLDKNKHLLKKI